MKKIVLYLIVSIISITAFGQTPRYAPVASPHFTGSPTAPTQTSTDNSTKIATTAFLNTFYNNNAVYFGTGLFTGAGTSGSPFILNTGSNYSWTVLQQFLANGIATTPTDILQVGNTTLSTVSVQTQYSGAINFFGHAWNTTSVADNIDNMRMYVVPVAGTSTFSRLVIDESINGGAYANVWSVNSFGQMTVGQTTTSGLNTAQTYVSRPSAPTAVNSTATLTAAQINTQCLTSTSAAAVTATLPSANSILTNINGVVGTTERLVVINTGPNTFTIALPATITTASAVTGGNNLVVAAAGSVPGSGVFELLWVTTTAAIIYRLQ